MVCGSRWGALCRATGLTAARRSPPQLSFETLCYSATETRKLIDLAGETQSVNCLPSEIVLVARHATGAITRWRLRLMDVNGQVTFTGLEVR